MNKENLLAFCLCILVTWGLMAGFLFAIDQHVQNMYEHGGATRLEKFIK